MIYIPEHWVHARGIDYHPRTPWACGFISLSPEDEAFIWGEFNPSPDRYTTKEICRELIEISGNLRFSLNLIDPESVTIKKDSISVLDDINREFSYFRKEGKGTGGYWNTWDTKGEKGRDAIQERLKNAKACKEPFNNRVIDEKGESYLPTLWVLDTAPISAKSLYHWRWQDTLTKDLKVKDESNKPQQKWSHFCTCYEAIFKHPGFRPRRNVYMLREERQHSYFRGR